MFTDPLDYALNYCLHPPPGGALARPGTWQAAFPALPTAEAMQLQLLALQELALDLGSRVNQELLPGKAAYPQPPARPRQAERAAGAGLREHPLRPGHRLALGSY